MSGIRMVERFEQLLQIGTPGRNFDGHCALPGCWQAVFRLDDGAYARGHAQTLEAGGGQNDGRVFAKVQLAQARIKVAAQRLDHQFRVTGSNQGL